MNRKQLRFFIPLFSLISALAVSSLIIILTGHNPLIIFQKMFRATFASPYGAGQLLFKTTTLILMGLAVALPFQMRLFNIGAEGQLLMGAFAAALGGIMLPTTLPPVLAISLCTMAGMVAGAGWALVAGALKTQFGVNEVIGTIMLNFIAQGIHK